MAQRRLGTLPLQENIETEKQMPLDARQLVRSKEEMLTEGSFTYGYKGLFTAERTEGKLWMLMDHQNPTQESSWKVIGPYDDSALDARVSALEQGGGGESGPVDWSDVQNKPSFASVATSGSYNDLADRPVLPAPYDDSALSGRVSALENAGFLTEHQDISGKANVADLSAVATSGSYNDLSDRPMIPEAYDDTGLRSRVSALEAKTETQADWNESDTESAAYIANKPTIPAAYDDTALATRVTALEESVPTLQQIVDGENGTSTITKTTGDGSSSRVTTSTTTIDAGSINQITTVEPVVGEQTPVKTYKGNLTLGGVEFTGPYKERSRNVSSVTLAAYDGKSFFDMNVGGNPGFKIEIEEEPTRRHVVALSTELKDSFRQNLGIDTIDTRVSANETALADRYTKAEVDAKLADAMVDVDNEHFHPVTVLPDSSVARENHEYVLITYAQDGTTIESETHYLFYGGVFHEKQTQVSLDGYATEAYVNNALPTIDAAMSDTSENPVQNKVVFAAIGDAIDVVDTAVQGLDTRVTAIETALNLTALTDEEIAALVPA